MNTKLWVGATVAALCFLDPTAAWAQKRIKVPAYSYEISSSYPYLKNLPPWEEIPVLLEWMNLDRKDAGIQVAYDQIVVMSRANFGQPGRPISRLPADALHYQRTNCVQRWQQWWEAVGKAYGQRLKASGRQNPDAWKLVTRDNHQPLPQSLVLIPDVWVLKTRFRTGDYGGVQTEAITLRRDKNEATLIRSFRKSTRGPLEWQEWKPLTIEQADTLAYAIAYAIDHPWLLEAPRNPASGTVPELEGRDFTLYYPWFEYALADGQGNTWWNDDPDHWLTDWNAYASFEVGGRVGSVCRVLWRGLPEGTTASSGAGWKPVKLPNAMVMAQVQDDLKLQDNILDALFGDKRVEDALETLKSFGSPEQLPAISRLEDQLRARLEAINFYLKNDPNVSGMRLAIDRMLSHAKQAKRTILERQAKAE